MRLSPQLLAIVDGVAFSALATAVFVGVLRLAWWVRGITLRRLSAFVRGGPVFTVAGFELVRREQLRELARRLVHAVAWAVAAVATYGWLAYVLTRFAYSRPWGEALGGYLLQTFERLLLGVLGAIPGLFTVALVFLLTRALARGVSAFFRAMEAGDVSVGWMHPDTAQPTRRIVVAFLWLFAVVIAYPYLPGSGSDVFKGVSVFMGIMLSLGSTGIVNQAMSGLVLMYSRAIRAGEYVRIGETEGTVAQVGILSTKIVTPRNEEITVPNAVMVGSPTTNFSRLAEERAVLTTTRVTIGYDAPWRLVHAMLLAAAERTPGLARDPVPVVWQTALDDFYVAYELLVRLERPDQRLPVLAALHANIQDQFNEHGVQIMSPHYVQQPATPVLAPAVRQAAPDAGDGVRAPADAAVPRVPR